LAVIFVIYPFVRIALARIDFIALNGNNIRYAKKPPFFWWATGYMTLKLVSESPDYRILVTLYKIVKFRHKNRGGEARGWAREAKK
jgi:hypothetical protein